MAKTQRRHTKSQQMVLDYFEKKEQAISHDMLEKALGKEMNRVTIYRILNRFEEDGIVHKIVSRDGVAHYAKCESHCNHNHHKDNHIHFRCTQCDTITCMDQTVPLALPTSYVVDNTNFLVSGICPKCNLDPKQ